MASAVDIYNLALSHIGNKALVVSPTDSSVEATHCNRFYPLALGEMLEEADWTFARKRATLSLLTTNPSTVWSYAYTAPSDCLTPRRIVTGDSSMLEQDSAAFEREGDYLFSNTADAVLIYTRNITDTGKFPPSFVSALGLKLGGYLAGAILKGESGVAAAKGLHAAASQRAKEATTSDANRSNTGSEFVPSGISARSGDTTGYGVENPVIYSGSGFSVA